MKIYPATRPTPCLTACAIGEKGQSGQPLYSTKGGDYVIRGVLSHGPARGTCGGFGESSLGPAGGLAFWVSRPELAAGRGVVDFMGRPLKGGRSRGLGCRLCKGLGFRVSRVEFAVGCVRRGPPPDADSLGVFHERACARACNAGWSWFLAECGASPHAYHALPA